MRYFFIHAVIEGEPEPIPDGELRRSPWDSVSQNYLALPDRPVTFANKRGVKNEAQIVQRRAGK